MLTTQYIPISECGDEELVARSLAAERAAFEQIVARYQTLVCSVTYAATGSLSQSEDLAQETFLTAWRRMSELREPEKLRSWLCAIARNLSAGAVRQSRRELSRRADAPLDGGRESTEPTPADAAISNEQQAILWRSLERIPAIYRQPMVLYYRQQESVRTVAEALDLSEDTVKQRLARGRKLLHGELAALVEQTLRQSAPKRAFTLGVLAALPLAATSAKAAAVGGAAAKGSIVAQTAGAVGLFNLLLGPLAGLLGAYIGIRSSIESARTPRERAFLVRHLKVVFVASLVFDVVLFAYILLLANMRWTQYAFAMTVVGIGLPLLWTVWLLIYIMRGNRQRRELRAEEQRLHPDAFPQAIGLVREYRSKATLLGLPLVHMRFSSVPGRKTQPAIGWIAIGDSAIGVLYAAGAAAIGLVSMGGISVGVISFGGVGIGLLAIAGCAVGGLAWGGVAIGGIAAGGVALAWKAALGGLVIARKFGLGWVVYARHANDATASAYVLQYPWLDLRRPLCRNLAVVIIWLPVLVFGFGQLFSRRRGVTGSPSQRH